MSKSTVIRAVGIGMAVGAVAGMAIDPMRRSPTKKRAKKALRLVAKCVDDLTGAMGL